MDDENSDEKVTVDSMNQVYISPTPSFMAPFLLRLKEEGLDEDFGGSLPPSFLENLDQRMIKEFEKQSKKSTENEKDKAGSSKFGSQGTLEADPNRDSERLNEGTLEADPNRDSERLNEGSGKGHGKLSLQSSSEEKYAEDLQGVSESEEKDLHGVVTGKDSDEDVDLSDTEDPTGKKTREKKKVTLKDKSKTLDKELEDALGDFDPREYVRTHPIIVGGIHQFLDQENVPEELIQHALTHIADSALTNLEAIQKLDEKDWPDEATGRSMKTIVGMTKDITADETRDETGGMTRGETGDETGDETRDRTRGKTRGGTRDGTSDALAAAFLRRIRTAFLRSKSRTSGKKEEKGPPTWADMIGELIQYHENSGKLSNKRFRPHLEGGRKSGTRLAGEEEEMEGVDGSRPSSISRLDSSGKVRPLTPTTRTMEHKEDCKSYLARHRIYDMFEFLTAAVVHELPDDPLTFLITLTHEMGRHYDVELTRSKYQEDVKASQMKKRQNDDNTCCP